MVGKHLLVYDVDWWAMGQKARIIKGFHPKLVILSQKKLKELVKQSGPNRINESYDMISTLGLGLTKTLLKWQVRVDSTQVGGYNYLANNIHTYREWKDEILLDQNFVNTVLKRVNRIGVVNPKLTKLIKELHPKADVHFLPQFVDTDHFKPDNKNRKGRKKKFVIGWVGNKGRKGKNFETLYKPIVKAFENDSNVRFKVTSKETLIPSEQMPNFYNSLDLLLVTSNNEGLPNPAVEATGCGVPVLSTNVGVVKTLAGEKAKSLVLDSHNPNDFIKKIRLLKNNPQFMNELKVEARENALNNWSVEKTKDKWLYGLFGIK
ncbi:glycosyltransferase family 1 protein [Salibacterium salarium]|uniref:Glycosyltransferase family 1 protein n=1 Tax=Salibacterium salarium TaxID=284579 RepID=A0A428MSD0_9BACI|nr:glycosyltransferase [Salibacterium salarium]RSL29029.1 glycosyltransferase family 1 protein [Salibacterium salarium]